METLEKNTPLLLTQCKAYCNIDEIKQFINSINSQGQYSYIALPTPILKEIAKMPLHQGIFLGAKSMDSVMEGSFTAPIAIPVLQRSQAKFVLVGSIESREVLKESNESINRKIQKLLEANLQPILCISQSSTESDQAEIIDNLSSQVKEGLDHLNPEEQSKVMILCEITPMLKGPRKFNLADSQAVYNIYKEAIALALSDEVLEKIGIIYTFPDEFEDYSGLIEQSSSRGFYTPQTEKFIPLSDALKMAPPLSDLQPAFRHLESHPYSSDDKSEKSEIHGKQYSEPTIVESFSEHEAEEPKPIYHQNLTEPLLEKPEIDLDDIAKEVISIDSETIDESTPTLPQKAAALDDSDDSNEPKESSKDSEREESELIEKTFTESSEKTDDLDDFSESEESDRAVKESGNEAAEEVGISASKPPEKGSESHDVNDNIESSPVSEATSSQDVEMQETTPEAPVDEFVDRINSLKIDEAELRESYASMKEKVDRMAILRVEYPAMLEKVTGQLSLLEPDIQDKISKGNVEYFKEHPEVFEHARPTFELVRQLNEFILEAGAIPRDFDRLKLKSKKLRQKLQENWDFLNSNRLKLKETRPDITFPSQPELLKAPPPDLDLSIPMATGPSPLLNKRIGVVKKEKRAES